MHAGAILFVLGNLLLISGASLLVPAGVAFATLSPTGNMLEPVCFIAIATFCVLLGAVSRGAFAENVGKIGVREGFAIVTGSWLLLVFVGMLPYLILGATHSITDAFFETMSGFTTTGATIFPSVEQLPMSLQLWRCMTQWLGGAGVVVLGVALLPALGAGGYRLLKAETPGGVTYEREQARITDAAKSLWRLYIGFSVVEFLLLLLCGMKPFDAICHTLTTMSTGGFSPHTASIAHFDSALIQWVLIVFMLIAGVNFSLHSLFLRGRAKAAFRNSEFLLYVGLIIFVTVLGVFLVASNAGLEQRIRDVAFQVVSIVTTTGYVTVDYDVWPQILRHIFLILMLVGGCMGSTSGGLKMGRLLIYAKGFVREFHQLVFPHAIRPLRLGKKVIEASIVTNIFNFGALFTLMFLIGTLTMASFGYDLPTSLSASAAALGNVGPGLSQVGPTQNWSELPSLAKWVLSFLMLAGRLELYSVLVLFTPWVWRR